MLMLLREQEEELARLTSAIDNLGERVDIHCEKVSRREVGSLTARKPISRGPAVKLPTNPERPVKYIRKAINYAEFDDIGHGIKTGGHATMRAIQKNASIRNSVGSAGSTGTLPRVMAQADPRYNSSSQELKTKSTFIGLDTTVRLAAQLLLHKCQNQALYR